MSGRTLSTFLSVLFAVSCASPSLAPSSHPLGELGDDPSEFEVPPVELAWDRLSPDIFDLRWVLPAERQTPGRDLEREMRALLTLRFDVRDADGRRLRSFGDLVAAARELEPDGRAAWLAQLEGQPALSSLGASARELLLDARLHTQDWSPDKAHPRDGLLEAETWNMEGEGPPWSDVDVRPLMEQAAALLHADLAAIKAVENDYRLYPSNAGADYEEILPEAGTYFVGADPRGRPFSTLTIRFRCDLPFPFSNYTTRLGILNRYDDADIFYTDIYSTSEDFYWLAGRDVFLPVETSDGAWVAFLLVRHFGFDLDGVPDDSGDRRDALRASLGNLKRNAEQLDTRRRASGSAPRNASDFLRDVRVLGRR